MNPRRRYDPDSKRRSNLKQRYGLTPEEYDALAARAQGKCPICLQKRPLCVDHCHDSGAVRGLICSPCNRSIGMLGDKVDPLKRAVAYLEKHYAKPRAAG